MINHDKMLKRRIAAVDAWKAARPGARKSFGQYKPLIVHADGRALIPPPAKAEDANRTHKRGLLFDTKAGAEVYAAGIIAQNIEATTNDVEKFKKTYGL